MASLTAAWLSAQTIQTFLREEIDQKFPAMLRSASDRLDAWYAQRELDIEMLAKKGAAGQFFKKCGTYSGRPAI